MKTYLLPKDGNFYKTNLHCHTNISDGKNSPEQIKEIYKSLGYSAVCYTDHDVLISHTELCDDSFIALHGYEIAVKKDSKSHSGRILPVYHFNFIAKSQDNLVMPRYFAKNTVMPGNALEWVKKCGVYNEDDTIEEPVYDIEWINDYLLAVSNAGFLISYNHPEWSLQNSSDYLGLKHIHAIETMNSDCFLHGDCTTIHFEQMCRNGQDVIPIGADDNHTEDTIGKSWTMIKAPELSYSSLIDAYENGDCYASTGPQINELYYEDGKVFISTSPASRILLRGEGRPVMAAYNCEDASFAVFPEKMGRYFRLEVKDAQGNLACTRAYKFEELEK